MQGAAWDPLGEYVATQSCDRTCRVYTVRNKKNGSIELRSHASNSKTDAPGEGPQPQPQGQGQGQAEPEPQQPQPQQQQQQQTRHRLYQDETVPSFFRR